MKISPTLLTAILMTVPLTLPATALSKLAPANTSSPASSPASSTSSDDHDSHHHSTGLTASAAWAAETGGRTVSAAAYAVLENHGDSALSVVGASSPAAETVMLHVTRAADNNVMRMMHVDALDIPAHGSVELKPGGAHIMLIRLMKPLVKGDHFPVTLTLSDGSEMTVDVDVTKIGGPSGDASAHAPAADHSMHH